MIKKKEQSKQTGAQEQIGVKSKKEAMENKFCKKQAAYGRSLVFSFSLKLGGFLE